MWRGIGTLGLYESRRMSDRVKMNQGDEMNVAKTQLETQVELEMCLYYANRACNETP